MEGYLFDGCDCLLYLLLLAVDPVYEHLVYFVGLLEGEVLYDFMRVPFYEGEFVLVDGG